MEVLDTAIVAVALPYIAGSLSASTTEATWVLTSHLIANAVTFLPATGFGLVGFIVHCLRSKTSLVSPRILRDRNFAVGCLLMVLFGLCVYSTITVLPLFYQELLGYTAFTAGVVVFPRGIGAIIAMPVIGFLGSRFERAISSPLDFSSSESCRSSLAR